LQATAGPFPGINWKII